MKPLRYDLRQHGLVGFGIVSAFAGLFTTVAYIAGTSTLHIVLVGLVGTLIGRFTADLAAWLKEDYDRRHPDKHSRDGWDAYATSIGAGAAQYLIGIAASIALLAVALGQL